MHIFFSNPAVRLNQYNRVTTSVNVSLVSLGFWNFHKHGRGKKERSPVSVRGRALCPRWLSRTLWVFFFQPFMEAFLTLKSGGLGCSVVAFMSRRLRGCLFMAAYQAWHRCSWTFFLSFLWLIHKSPCLCFECCMQIWRSSSEKQINRS